MLTTLLTGFVGGIAAWFFTEFITQPLRRFVDMRREVTRCLVVYGNVGFRSARDQSGKLTAAHLSTDEDARLVEAQNAFRDLSAKMYGGGIKVGGSKKSYRGSLRGAPVRMFPRVCTPAQALEVEMPRVAEEVPQLREDAVGYVP